jgi:hypothetical protein
MNSQEEEGETPNGENSRVHWTAVDEGWSRGVEEGGDEDISVRRIEILPRNREEVADGIVLDLIVGAL